MSKLTSALLKASFLNVTGYEQRIGDEISRISITSEDKMSLSIEKNVICVIDENGHSWIRPNLFKDTSDKKMVERIHRLVRSNRSCAVPFAKDSNRFIRQVWPHLLK